MALIIADVGAEKVPHFEEALGGIHIFAVHGAADRGLVDTDFFGDFLHAKRFEMGGTFVKEFLLGLNDRFGDGEDSAFTKGDVVEEHFGFTHLAPKFLSGGAIVDTIFEVGADFGIDAHVGEEIVVGFDTVGAVVIPGDDDVGTDRRRGVEVEVAPGAWVKFSELADSRGYIFEWDTELAGNHGPTIVGQFVAEIAENAVGKGIGFTCAFKLEHEAMARVTGADAGRIETLQEAD